MRVGILLASMLVIPSFASAQTSPSPYRHGVDARLAGDNVRAAELLAQVVRAEPRNADALVQLGLARLALGELDAAQSSFDRALAIAPDYADARIGLARVAQRRGDVRRARTLLDPVDPANADARALRAQLESTPVQARFSADLDLTYSDLDDGQQDWRQADLRFGFRPNDATTLTASAEWARRFGRKDLYGEMRVDHRFSRRGSAYLTLGGTPDADFRPKWQIGAGASARIRGGANPTVLTIDGRASWFPSGEVQSISPGIEQYLLDGKAWLTARWINTFDENGDHRGGWLARGDLQATDRLRLFAGASDAADTSEGVVLRTSSLFGGILWSVSDRYVLRASIAHEQSKTAADRTHLSVGLGVRF